MERLLHRRLNLVYKEMNIQSSCTLHVYRIGSYFQKVHQPSYLGTGFSPRDIPTGDHGGCSHETIFENERSAIRQLSLWRLSRKHQMVRVSCNAAIPVDSDQSHLHLAVTHTLSVLPCASNVSSLFAQSTELPIRLRASTIPENIPVRAHGSQVPLRVLGSLNGRQIDPQRVLKSGMVHELTRFIRKVQCTTDHLNDSRLSRICPFQNTELLGLHSFSGPAVAGDAVECRYQGLPSR